MIPSNTAETYYRLKRTEMQNKHFCKRASGVKCRFVSFIIALIDADWR